MGALLASASPDYRTVSAGPQRQKEKRRSQCLATRPNVKASGVLSTTRKNALLTGSSQSPMMIIRGNGDAWDWRWCLGGVPPQRSRLSDKHVFQQRNTIISCCDRLSNSGDLESYSSLGLSSECRRSTATLGYIHQAVVEQDSQYASRLHASSKK